MEIASFSCTYRARIQDSVYLMVMEFRRGQSKNDGC